jgi:predicted metal-dependent hydrolase
MTYELIRTKRKTIALSVDTDGRVVVRAPLRARAEIIDRFFIRYQTWVKEKRAQVLEYRKQVPPKSFKEGELFFYLGEILTLAFAKTPQLTRQGDILYSPVTSPTLIKSRLKKWYKGQTQELVTHLVAMWAPRMQVAPKSLSITRANRQWGACSHGGKLYFSWRLSMAPLRLIEYVAVHELAHIAHHNHSVSFWKKVEQSIPDYKTRRLELQKNAFRYKF